MSFLDNLENSLKSLENQAERGPGERQQREAERSRAMAAAPWAELLKSSPFTQDLLKQATRVGFQMRAKVYIAWVGTSLKLEARERKLELRPTAEGIVAIFVEPDGQQGSEAVDLNGNAEEFVRKWLASTTL